jgi:NAD(P)H-nitrite reductase large subunit
MGRIDGSTEETLAVDTLCLGFGFIPAVQLSRQAGCDHRYEHQLGGWVPVRDEWLETTVQGIFAAGDGTGIRGKDAAYFEGQLAGLGVARSLGKTGDPQRVVHVSRDLDRQRRFADALSNLFPTPALGADLLTEDTVICRCEGITAREIRQRISEGATTLGMLRKLTRVGMGRCQARFCGHTVADLLACKTGQPMNQLEVATPRPPVMPVPLHGLAEDPSETLKSP